MTVKARFGVSLLRLKGPCKRASSNLARENQPTPSKAGENRLE